MGGKSFTSAVVLPCDEHGEPAALPRLAIGSSDGTIRVLNGFKPEALQVVFGAKGGAAVSALAVAPIQGRDALVTGALPRFRCVCTFSTQVHAFGTKMRCL